MVRTRPRFDEEAHDSSEMGYWESVMFVLDYSRTPLIRSPIGPQKLTVLTMFYLQENVRQFLPDSQKEWP